MDGILVVDKPQGITSHDVVHRIRKTFAIKKVGHAGTLDPMATGVLVVLLGKCTKSSASLTSEDKVYEAALTLGCESDTGDIWGNLHRTGADLNIPEDKIEDAFNKFLGETEQMPPMYSAVKFKGRKLYQLARRGIKVELEPRKIHIKEIRVTRKDLPEIAFNLICSKGTYVRQICVDIGKLLGCGACLSSLRRTRSGRFTIESALPLSEIEMMDRVDLEKRICPV